MSLPSFSTVLRPRPEILSSEQPLLDMISLADLVRRPSARKKGLAAHPAGRARIDDPEALFAITYPTLEMRETLRTLAQRLTAPQNVPGVILLESHYGAGKSHVLAAAHHALTRPDLAAAWAQQWQLPPLVIPPGARVITLSLIENTTQHLWDLLFEPLGKPVILRKDVPYPDGETVQSLLDDQPLVLILDELERWYDSLEPKSQSRNRNFLQALSEVAMRDPRLTLLTSLLGEKPEPAETLRRVRPMILGFSSPDDRLRILQFRMFENFGSHDRSKVMSIVNAYCDAYARGGIPEVDTYRSRMLETWPFTPEFVDVLIKRVPHAGGFQNTRGTLHFLSVVIQATHGRRPLISSQDLPIRNETLANMLQHLDTPNAGEVVRRARIDNYEAVRPTLTCKDALFSTLLFYSVADPSRPGISEQELLLACLSPEVNRLLLLDALAELKKVAHNLHLEGDLYLFKTLENPHARIHAVASSARITPGDCEALLKECLLRTWEGARDQVVIYTGDDTRCKQELRAGSGHLRLLISARGLSPDDRWRLQNLDLERNLVILIEPLPRSVRGVPSSSLLAHEKLLELARRVLACRLLLEARPSDTSRQVYERVSTTEITAIEKLMRELYGQHVQWHPLEPGRSGPPDYELNQFSKLQVNGFLEHFRKEISSQTQVEVRLEALAPLYQRRRLAELKQHFERTLGEPVLIDAPQFFSALREVLKRRLFALQNERGERVQDFSQLPEGETLNAILVPPPSQEPAQSPPAPAIHPPLVHVRVSGGYEQATSTVRLAWAYPTFPPGSSGRTLVQRYTTARGWQEGQVHHLDLDTTHSANRYLDRGDDFLEQEAFTPGELLVYYVFLVEERSGSEPRIVLSRRVDILIPHPPRPDKAVLDIGPASGFGAFMTALERTVLNSQNMSADSRVRKLELTLQHGEALDRIQADFPALKTLQGPELQVESAVHRTLTFRGELERQSLQTLLRQLLKDTARDKSTIVSARLFMKQDPSQAGG